MKNTIFVIKLIYLILQKLPEGLLLPDNEQSQSSDLSDIPLSIGSPAVNYLDPEYISNYCTPLPGIQVEKSVNQKVLVDLFNWLSVPIYVLFLHMGYAIK
jgi:hypothetical protein